MTYRNTRDRKVRGIITYFSLSLAFVACTEPEESLSTKAPTQVWDGTLSKVMVEGHGPNSGAHYFLKVKDSQRVLELNFETPTPMVTGADLTVEGIPSEARFRVTNYTARERPLNAIGKAEQPILDGPVLKTRTVGVVTVDSNEEGMQVTNDLLRRLVLDADNPGPLLGIGPTDKSARQYYSEVSYGGYRLRGAVEGPFSWNGSACIGGAEDVANVLRGELSSTYDSYVWYFDSVDEHCGYAWGEEGTWNNPAQNTWFNGRFDANVFSHELGHNIGLMHASTLSCGGKPFADDPLTCVSDEYGSRYSVMGTGGIRHLNAIEKWYLTWFSRCNGVRVRQSGTWSLLPIEIPCNGIQALQIPMPKRGRTFFTEQSEEPTEIKYYYLELHTSQKLDTGMTPSVLVHVSDGIRPPSESCARTALLDMNPSTSQFDGLRAGESYEDPTGDLTFRVDSLDENKAMVSVTMASNRDTTTCMDGSVLIGPGPDTCDEPFLVADGAYGNYINHPIGNGTYDGDATNLGGSTATSDAALGGYSTVTGGGQPGKADTTSMVANFDAAEDCSCRIGGPKPNGPHTFGWATLSVLSLIVSERKRRRRNVKEYA